MTTFWVLTGLLGAAVSALLVLALLRGRRDTGPAEAFDLQVYRDQLAEIERDAAKGSIVPEEAERLRTEVSRRILTADAKAQTEAAGAAQPQGAAMVMAAVMVAVVLGGGFWLYSAIGAPGYGDLPLQTRIARAAEARDDRPSQAEAEAQLPATAPAEIPDEYMELVVKLREAVTERPDDLQGFTLLARSEASLGNFQAAYAAQERIVVLKGAEATAKDFADLADMMILAAGGYVSPEAQAALEEALARDPQNGVARYYGGLMMAQTGRPDVAFRMWDRLLSEGPGDAPWIPPIREQIEEMAYRAGVPNFTMPEAEPPRGPSQADIDAASEMSEEDRQAMIQGMVANLSDRLATEGGPPADWARLIAAYGVLGNTDQAAAIWANAQEVFADNAEALELVREGARRAGVAQ
ncbi:MAG: c-type cytochrome biogenesis protein CcmI [Paracoccaceae bacterium]|nr:c-type cytochrome biogenesis protein CcmI [Paracoccaceae bacterium]